MFFYHFPNFDLNAAIRIHPAADFPTPFSVIRNRAAQQLPLLPSPHAVCGSAPY